jgi:hypothetical protein
MRFAGCDPGQTGACVVVDEDGETVLAVQTWEDAELPPALTILDGVVVLALEEQYIGPGAHASLTLAAWSIRMLDSLPSSIQVLRPLATSWRAKVFRGPRLRRAAAKRKAIEAASPYLVDHVAKVTPDVAEAWAMARYAWGWATQGPGRPS